MVASTPRVRVILLLLGACGVALCVVWVVLRRAEPKASAPAIVPAAANVAASSGAAMVAADGISGAGAEADANALQTSLVIEREQRRVRIPLRVDRRPDFGQIATMDTGRVRKEVPDVFARFDDWLARLEAASPAERGRLLPEGADLLKRRMALWPEWARRDPEGALLLSPSPARRALLPEEMEARLEQPLAATGFYGVRAACTHGEGTGHGSACRVDHEVIVDGRVLEAAIYGERRERLTEEDASLYGVVLGDLIALHADDVVMRPMDANRSWPVEAVFRGRVTRLEDPAALSAFLQSLVTP